MNERIKNAVEVLDREFDKASLDWLISLYDPKSGGFYYAVSSRDNDRFGPDIESVVQGVSCMQTLGLVPRDEDGKWVFPDWFKKGAVDFLRSRQDPDDGYFYDPQYKEIAKKDKLERNTGFALSFLRGDMYEQPLYPTPNERLKAALAANQKTDKDQKNANTGLGVYQNKETFLKWLEEISATRTSYSWGSDLASGASMIAAAGLTDTLVEWLVEKQNKENGTWANEFNMQAVNGVLKLCGFFNPDTVPYPNLDTYLSSVIEFTKTFNPVTAAEVWNPLGTVKQIVKNHPDLSSEMRNKVDESIAEMIENTTVQMRKFRQPDGGFGYLMKGSSEWSNSVIVSLGLPEGDVNAMALMMLTYNEAHILTGIPRSDPWGRWRDYFWEKMKQKREKYVTK